ncbi:hypothetical protein KPH14_013122, partial [Odynerus spinipes]
MPESSEEFLLLSCLPELLAIESERNAKQREIELQSEAWRQQGSLGEADSLFASNSAAKNDSSRLLVATAARRKRAPKNALAGESL